MKKLQFLVIALQFLVLDAVSQQITQESLTNNDNFVNFYKEMRLVSMMYVDGASKVSQEQVAYAKKHYQNIHLSVQKIEEESDSIIISLDNQVLFGNLISELLPKIDSLKIADAKNGVTLEDKFNRYEKDDVITRAIMGMNEQAYRKHIGTAKRALQFFFDEMPDFNPESIDNIRILRACFKELDNKHYKLDSCKADFFEASIQHIITFLKTEARLVHIPKTDKAKTQYSLLFFHTDMMPIVYRYNVCLGR